MERHRISRFPRGFRVYFVSACVSGYLNAPLACSANQVHLDVHNMGEEYFEKSIELPVPAESAFAWHESPGAFERLVPPWIKAEIVSQHGGLQDGGEVVIRMQRGLVPLKWVAMHQNYLLNKRFQDIQVKGPFKSWTHIHRFDAVTPEKSLLADSIAYQLPGGWLGAQIAGRMIRSDLEKTFRYRHDVTRADLISHQKYADKPRQKILISGANGLVGRALTAFLSTGGHDVWHLTRKLRGAGKKQIVWDATQIAPGELEPFDTIIHLAGENIFGLWTGKKKRAIRDSRVDSTRALAQALSRCPPGSKSFICASAIGYYGNRGDEIIDETSAPGTGWLAQIAREWEAAAQIARDAGVRTAHLRLGVVLTPAGGALGKMLLPFRLGLGGRIASGTQWMSWVSIEDVIGAFHHAVMNPDFEGVANLTAPHPVRNEEFTRTLGKLLGRPAIFPVPAFAGKMVLGEMFESLLLSSTRVLPRKLPGSGYMSRHPTLESALRFLLGK